MVLCSVYYMNQVTGFEDKYEMTHASARTKDLGYGRTTLAISNAAKAVDNTENYAFFTDKLYIVN